MACINFKCYNKFASDHKYNMCLLLILYMFHIGYTTGRELNTPIVYWFENMTHNIEDLFRPFTDYMSYQTEQHHLAAKEQGVYFNITIKMY